MADVYHRYVASVQQTEFETAKIKTTIPRFQWFAGAALLLLLLEGSLANGPWRTGLVGLVQRSWSPKSKKANAADAAGSTAPVPQRWFTPHRPNHEPSSSCERWMKLTARRRIGAAGTVPDLSRASITRAVTSTVAGSIIAL